jgi:nucleoside-diphosphate-sugar epimerase
MRTQELHVVFGVGGLGRAVVEELVRRGRRVRAVNRSGAADLPDGVETVRADASDPRAAAQAARGATVIYQCAQPDYTRWPEEFPQLQASILDAAAAAGARLIIGDNLYMYGAASGPLTEDTPYAPISRKGRVRAQMAEEALAAHRSGKVRVALGRASNFYGPHCGAQGWFNDRVVPPLLAGKTVSLLGNPDLPHTFSYIEDFGAGLVVLGEHDEALGQAWHIPNARTRTPRQVLTAFFEQAGRPPKIGRTPTLAVRALGLFNPLIREVSEMLYEFEEPFVVDHGKFVRTFGNIATAEAEAIRRTLNWYQGQPAAVAVAHS